MMVLVDTSVWSLAFRRKYLNAEEAGIVQQLQTLILDGNACMAGVIRQEILSGIKHAGQYEKLQKQLQAFPDLTVTRSDHERAAGMFNTCRQKGVQGSHIDFLICALAYSADIPVFTVDGDFQQYARHIPLSLHPLDRGANRIHEPAPL